MFFFSALRIYLFIQLQPFHVLALCGEVCTIAVLYSISSTTSSPDVIRAQIAGPVEGLNADKPV